jgi:hypothetical protein
VATTAVTIGTVALAEVGHDKYLRFVWPSRGPLSPMIRGFVALGAAFT